MTPEQPAALARAQGDVQRNQNVIIISMAYEVQHYLWLQQRQRVGLSLHHRPPGGPWTAEEAAGCATLGLHADRGPALALLKAHSQLKPWALNSGTGVLYKVKVKTKTRTLWGSRCQQSCCLHSMPTNSSWIHMHAACTRIREAAPPACQCAVCSHFSPPAGVRSRRTACAPGAAGRSCRGPAGAAWP